MILINCNGCGKMVFMECTLDSERKPSFKSKPLFVVYEEEDMKDKILGHIIWLLEET